jgi:hypothetical protein
MAPERQEATHNPPQKENDKRGVKEIIEHEKEVDKSIGLNPARQKDLELLQTIFYLN